MKDLIISFSAIFVVVIIICVIFKPKEIHYPCGIYEVRASDGAHFYQEPNHSSCNFGYVANSKNIKVSKVSDNWGYVASYINCGEKKTGWVDLTYCKLVKPDPMD